MAGDDKAITFRVSISEKQEKAQFNQVANCHGEKKGSKLRYSTGYIAH